MKKALLALAVVVTLAGITQVTNAAVNRGAWDQDTQWIDSTFWAQSPTDDDIIWAMYGTGGDLDTVYSQTWNTKGCTPSSMSVTYVSPGTDTIPSTLSADTIYVLAPGDYVKTAMISMSSCSAIIATGTANLYSSTQVATAAATDAMVRGTSVSNIILQGITIDGENNGAGGTHTRNIGGVMFNGVNNSTAHDLVVTKFTTGGTWPNYGGAFRVLGSAQYNLIHDTDGSYSDYGFSFTDAATVTNNVLDGGRWHNCTVGGISAYLSVNNVYKNVEVDNNYLGIYLYDSDNNTIENVDVHNNSDGGILLTNNADANTITGALVHDNPGGGYGAVRFQTASVDNLLTHSKIMNNAGDGAVIITAASTTRNKVSHSQFMNNTTFAALRLGSSATNTTVNDVIFMNNNIGVYCYQSHNTVVNNSIFVNNNSGIEEYSNNFLINNTVISNGTYGITTDGRAGATRVNNVKLINNTTATREVNGAATITYYGDFEMINNGTDATTTTVSQGTDGLGLGFANGNLTTTSSADLLDEVLNPYNGTLGEFLFADASCTYTRAKNASRTTASTDTLSYWFGVNLPTQTQPYEYTTSYVTSSLARNGADQIARVNDTKTPLQEGWDCAFSTTFIISAGALNGSTVGAAALPKAVPQQVTFSWNNRTSMARTASTLSKLLSTDYADLAQGTGEVTFNLSPFKSSTLFGDVTE